MAKNVYIGVNGQARKVKKMYVGVNGAAREVKKAYTGVGGLARLFYPAVAAIPDGLLASISLPSVITDNYPVDSGLLGEIYGAGGEMQPASFYGIDTQSSDDAFSILYAMEYESLSFSIINTGFREWVKEKGGAVVSAKVEFCHHNNGELQSAYFSGFISGDSGWCAIPFTGFGGHSWGLEPHSIEMREFTIRTDEAPPATESEVYLWGPSMDITIGTFKTFSDFTWRLEAAPPQYAGIQNGSVFAYFSIDPSLKDYLQRTGKQITVNMRVSFPDAYNSGNDWVGTVSITGSMINTPNFGQLYVVSNPGDWTPINSSGAIPRIGE